MLFVAFSNSTGKFEPIQKTYKTRKGAISNLPPKIGWQAAWQIVHEDSAGFVLDVHTASRVVRIVVIDVSSLTDQRLPALNQAADAAVAANLVPPTP